MDFEIDLQDFIDEANDQVKELNDGLLTLEQNIHNEEVIHTIFRAAHTLKGGAGLVGFDKIMELTHNLENVFELIREKKLAITPEHLDVMFEVLDVLVELMGEVESGEFNTDTGKVIEKLAVIISEAGGNSGAKTSAKKEAKTDAPESAFGIPQDIIGFLGRGLLLDEEKKFQQESANTSRDCVGIALQLSDSCAVPSLFMFMVFNKLREMGTIVACNPLEEDIEENEAIEAKLILFTEKADNELKLELNMPDVEKIDLRVFRVEAPAVEIFEEDVIVEASESIEEETQPPEVSDIKPSVVVKPENEATPAAKTSKNKSKMGKSQMSRSSSSLRVDSGKIDILLNLVGELVINKARFLQMGETFASRYGRNTETGILNDTVMQLARVTNELQEGIMQLRMVAVDQVFSKFPRVVRDLSRNLGKNIEIILEGKDTELDKTVVEEIGDPLMHLVRNSVDHGIESETDRIKMGKDPKGQIVLRAYHQGSSIIIEVEDNGKGIDPQKMLQKAIEKGLTSEEDSKLLSTKDMLHFIFAPGFSTAEEVSDLSGRGVGMDVVRRNVEKLNGVIDVTTKKDVGSKFVIKLPLTLAIIPALLTIVEKTVYAIPLVNVVEIVEITKAQISMIAKKEAIRLRDEVINILRLDEVFFLGSSNRNREKVQVVIIGLAENRVGLVVDDLIGEQEIVIKSLDSQFTESPGITGATILGDGTVALIVDVFTLIERVLQEMH